jgi:hypothetical protein
MGQLKSRLNKLDSPSSGDTPASDAAPPSPPATSFVPLSSLKK